MNEALTITFYDAAGEIVAQTVVLKPTDTPETPEGAVFVGVSTQEWHEQATKTPLPPGHGLMAARTEGRWQKVKHPPAVLRARQARA